MSIASSDYSTARSSNVASRRLYSDLDLGLPIHPVKKDIIPLSDIRAVKNAVKNLVLTNFSEKPFQPRFGGNLNSFLFALNTDIDDDDLREQIIQAIEIFEPRIQVLNIDTNLRDDSHEIKVTVTFKMINTSETISTQVNLTRLR